MKGEVINTFRDKFHYNTIYEVGTVVDFDKERMKDLIARGLCKKVDEKPSAKKDDKEKKKEVLADPEPKANEETKKEVLADPEVKEEAKGETKEDELDEKIKSEQEAAEKIAKATAKANKK